METSVGRATEGAAHLHGAVAAVEQLNAERYAAQVRRGGRRAVH